MPVIYIQRNSEWANKMRNFELYLNGKKIGDIGDLKQISIRSRQVFTVWKLR